ncbi:DUF4399 domain-containing protein [Bacteroidota bacterium]
MKYLFLSATVAAFLSACSPTTNTEETATEETVATANEHDHAGHAHEAPAGVTIQPIKEGQKVFFANLEDGQSVASPLTVEFGVEGMTAAPAGEIIEDQGHHHLLIDHDFIAAGEVIPAGDSTKLHFGKGQLTTEVNLAPGTHKLTMQFANGAHMSYGEKMSTSINVTVK